MNKPRHSGCRTVKANALSQWLQGNKRMSTDSSVLQTAYFGKKPQLCKLCCHHTLQEALVGWFALSPRFAHRFLTSHELHKWRRRGKIPRILLLWAGQGSFFCWGVWAVLAVVQSITGWLCLMTRGTTAPLSWLPIPRKCTSAWLLSPKESHMYSASLLFINLTCDQRAADETDFFNQIVLFFIKWLGFYPFSLPFLLHGSYLCLML